MLPAQHSSFHKRLLFAYVRRRLRKSFHSIQLCGGEEVLKKADSYPIVFYSNHETWWDGFLEIPLMIEYQLDYYVMMEEANLRKFPFFQKCGVFGIDLETARGRANGLLYTVRLLREAGKKRRAIFIYPHGRFTPIVEGPIPPFMDGLAAILRLAPEATAVPIYKTLRFGRHPLPEVLLEVGEPLDQAAVRDSDGLRTALEKARHVAAARIADLYEREVLPDSVQLLPSPRRYRGKS